MNSTQACHPFVVSDDKFLLKFLNLSYLALAILSGSSHHNIRRLACSLVWPLDGCLAAAALWRADGRKETDNGQLPAPCLLDRMRPAAAFCIEHPFLTKAAD
jgi:hypothetical protein